MDLVQGLSRIKLVHFDCIFDRLAVTNANRHAPRYGPVDANDARYRSLKASLVRIEFTLAQRMPGLERAGIQKYKSIGFDLVYKFGQHDPREIGLNYFNRCYLMPGSMILS